MLFKTILSLETALISQAFELKFFSFLEIKEDLWRKIAFCFSTICTALKQKLCDDASENYVQEKALNIHFWVIQEYALSVVGKKLDKTKLIIEKLKSFPDDPILKYLCFPNVVFLSSKVMICSFVSVNISQFTLHPWYYLITGLLIILLRTTC